VEDKRHLLHSLHAYQATETKQRALIYERRRGHAPDDQDETSYRTLNKEQQYWKKPRSPSRTSPGAEAAAAATGTNKDRDRAPSEARDPIVDMRRSIRKRSDVLWKGEFDSPCPSVRAWSPVN
jgi:hypothetical protein